MMTDKQRIDSLSEALRVMVDKISELTTQMAALEKKVEMIAEYIASRPIGLA